MKKLDSTREALFYRGLAGKKVQCELCPRNCLIEEGKSGYCGVRKNNNGVLYAASYGKAAHMSEEVVETEAVFHFEPGSKILSLGNVGCNLACVYCQNWKFSQIQHADEDTIFDYTPEQVVSVALERNIKVLSWTYNDPAVWIEFVIDTARLARKHGLYNLFKSAMFLNPKPVEALMDVIDIFTASIKSVSRKYHAKYTKGWPKPIMDAVKQIYDAKRHHLEVSNLIVTGASDEEKDYNEFIAWFKANLGPEVPVHFVCFHPAYQYTQVKRTPETAVIKARELAMKEGLKYPYLGNVFSHEGLNTYCKSCNNLLVERIGLNATQVGLEPNCKKYICGKCKAPTSIKMAYKKEECL
jgi:pyruvate formate lyase activating enzyme